ncbi:MAG: TMEM165/GDT1 family protein [Prochloraceae cyanobacterium]
MTSIEPAKIKPTDNETAETKETVDKAKWGFGAAFSSTFVTIFIAEMGDKTQIATLLMSAQSQSPWVVFAGAATALIATSLLGVLVGYWMAKRLSPKTLDISVGILMLVISGLLVADVVS